MKEGTGSKRRDAMAVMKDVAFQRQKTRRIPDGVSSIGLTGRHAEELGRLVSIWPQLEDDMVLVFQHLLGGTSVSHARVVFQSIVNADHKIRIMLGLLEKCYANAEQKPWFDKTLKDLRALCVIRNRYVHGSWRTHENGTVYLDDMTGEDETTSRRPKVPLQDVVKVRERAESLMSRVSAWHARSSWPPGVPPPSPDTHPSPPSEET